MSIKSVLQEGDPLRYDFGCWRVVSVNEYMQKCSSISNLLNAPSLERFFPAGYTALQYLGGMCGTPLSCLTPILFYLLGCSDDDLSAEPLCDVGTHRRILAGVLA
jgi:hypothetical protein